MKTKVCKKCGRELEATLENFYKASHHKDGLKVNCKKCSKEYNKKYYQNHKEENRVNCKRYQQEHYDTIQRRRQKYREENREKIRARNKKYREENRERRRVSSRKHYWKNRDKILAYNATPKGRLSGRMSACIRKCLGSNKNGWHWETLVGYTLDDLKMHIEKHFTKGMNWEKLINGEIHIDHITPVSAFNFTDPSHEDFKRCWALSNLQPLWAKENISKGAKLREPHQPTLALAAE